MEHSADSMTLCSVSCVRLGYFLSGFIYLGQLKEIPGGYYLLMYLCF